MSEPDQPPVTPPPAAQPPTAQPPVTPPPAAQPPAYGAAPPYQPYAQPYGQQGAPARYNVLAIVSLISAFFFSLVAIITGHIALSQIKRTGEQGRGLAIAGLVLGYAGLLVGLIALTVIIVVAATNPDLFQQMS